MDYLITTKIIEQKLRICRPNLYICTENNQKYREVFDNDANNTINDKEDVISKSDDGEIAIEENNSQICPKQGIKLKR